MRTLYSFGAVVALGMAAAVLAPSAHATDWSVSVGIGVPGVVVVSPPPDYVPPPPAYYVPPAYAYAPGYYPPERYYRPPTVIGYWGHERDYYRHREWWHHHHHHHDDDD